MVTLSDAEVFERLHSALIALGNDEAAGEYAQNSLFSARVALTAIQMTLIAEIERVTGRN